MSLHEINVPDIGDYKEVDIIEINVELGSSIKKETSLITLETDKASMEIPSPIPGIVKEISVKVGDKISEGDLILKVESEDMISEEKEASYLKEENLIEKSEKVFYETNAWTPYTSPMIRKLARKDGVDLSLLSQKNTTSRITKSDYLNYLTDCSRTERQDNRNNSHENIFKSTIDFSLFGEIENRDISNINYLSSKNLSENWKNIPHVTLFGEADIEELDKFRLEKYEEAKKINIKLTLLPFLMKSIVTCLKKFPRFNSSLSNNGKFLIIKKYYNIGFAVDTPRGLVVPVVKKVDTKNVFEIAREISDLVEKSRSNKLSMKDIQGASFSISNLGNLGDNFFTPIINAPEVSIIGISKIHTKPIWNGERFIPRQVLPLSLSIDHRVINGALAIRFITKYCSILKDIRESLL